MKCTGCASLLLATMGSGLYRRSSSRGADCFPSITDSDCGEYLKEDSFVIYHRVDDFLTIIFDETKIVPVGFKLKGFKHVFNMHLKSRFELIDKQFLLLAAAIEAV